VSLDRADRLGPFVILDVDSTLIEDEVIELFADLAGTRDVVADITARAMQGEIDFAQSLRERVATLEGLPTDAFADVLSRVRITTGARELIDAVHDADGRVGVVSGGFHEVLDPLAEDLELDHWHANRFEVEGGRLTGRVAGGIVDARAKADALREWSAYNGVPLDRAVAVGDGANDLEMMAIAGLAVAFDAKPLVREKANVAITRRDLRDVLPLLGLRG
jgi:phosphoserine phosphatase